MVESELFVVLNAEGKHNVQNGLKGVAFLAVLASSSSVWLVLEQSYSLLVHRTIAKSDRRFRCMATIWSLAVLVVRVYVQ